MNWVLVGVIVVLVLNALWGSKRGMIRIVLSLVTLIATIFLTMALTPLAGNFVKENTDWYSNLNKATYEGLQSKDTVGKAFTEIGQTDVADTIAIPDSQYSEMTSQVIDTLTLPNSLKDQIVSQISTNKFVTDGVTSAKEAVAKFLAEQIASIIFNIIIFVVIFMVIYIIMQIIIRVADIVSMLPVIKQINKTGGLVLGLVKGLIVVWVFFIAMTIFCDTEFAKTVFAYVNDNSFLSFLYNNNLILNFILEII